LELDIPIENATDKRIKEEILKRVTFPNEVCDALAKQVPYTDCNGWCLDDSLVILN